MNSPDFDKIYSLETKDTVLRDKIETYCNFIEIPGLFNFFFIAGNKYQDII